MPYSVAVHCQWAGFIQLEEANSCIRYSLLTAGVVLESLEMGPARGSGSVLCAWRQRQFHWPEHVVYEFFLLLEIRLTDCYIAHMHTSDIRHQT